MKILLATLSIEPASRSENHPDAAYSIGLSYIHSVLGQKGHDVELLFLNNFGHERSEDVFFKRVDDWRPQLVGFQIFSMNRVSTFSAIRKLQTRHTDIKIVIGGVHTSVMYAQILKEFPHVIAVIGEGEQTFAELAECFESGRSYDDLAGIAYCRDGTVIVTRPRKLLKDLDALPFPRHEKFFDNEPGRTVAHVISSRGCPFDCSFCCLKAVSMRKYRARDMEKVVEEIKHLKTRYPRLRRVQFHDDSFMLDNRRVIEFCKMIIAEHLGLKFICSARVKPISGEMFHWMEKAGFVKIMFGLETGSPKLLESIHKKVTRTDVINLFNTLKPFNFITTTFLMCGFPGEDDVTIQETIDLVKTTQKISYNWIAGIGKLWVYPGTEVYDIMKKRGKISDDFWLSGRPVPYFTAEQDLGTLIKFEEKLMNHLSIFRIFNPKGFIHHFMNMPLTIIRFLLRIEPREALSVIKVPLQHNFPRLCAFLLRMYKTC